MYLASERRAYILRLLEQRGSIRSAELARELRVTDETIRTDLVQLQAEGLLRRKHGGAVYIPPTGGEADLMRLDCQLAELILPQLQAGSCFYLDAAPFALALQSRMGQLPCRLICPSLSLLAALSKAAAAQEIFCPAGQLERKSRLILPPQEETAPLPFPLPQAAILYPDAVQPQCIAYHCPVRAAWAAWLIRLGVPVILAVPARSVEERAEHGCACRPALIVGEDVLPETFHGIPLAMVPHISAEELLPDSGFDY